MSHDKSPSLLDSVFRTLSSWAQVPRQLATHDQLLEELMTGQQELDARVATLTRAWQEVTTEIANLKAQPGAESLDFTELDNVITGIDDEVLTPVDTEPPVDPADPSAPVDPSAPA